jgi:hypothetical protein
VLQEKDLPRYTTIDREKNCIQIALDAPLDFVPDETVPNYIDSAEWEPEIADGGWVGLYHQWYPLVNGHKELKLFFVCQSHCRLAGIEIKQIVNSIPENTSVYDLAVSEEFWWCVHAMRPRKT